ncbi:M48 family metalloprotease [Nocardioides solisilvae]|uniref:M48 family metalloprotease n=1 Tax=Nocardioides solisilvae TaxID=1542435 RepID=UPI001EF4A0A5|nr:M48 family metalloprotease [Nocardioides solisilvae]
MTTRRLPDPSARRVAWLLVVVASSAFAVAAWWLVPWEPVPGGTPDPVAPSSLFTAEELARAEAFSAAARAWSWSSLALTLIVLVAAAASRRGERLVERLPGPWWLRATLATALLLVVARLVTLPLAVGAWRLRVDRGLSTQSAGPWLADLARSEAVEVLTVAAVVLVLVGTHRRWRTWAPVVAATVLGGSVVVGSYAYPLVVEPLFHSFEPLPPGALRDAVTEGAAEQGVAVDDVVVADASRRTTTLNAWVSGLGGSRRVVLYDNLVQEVPRGQVLAVVAHELAHARHGDVAVGTALGALGTAGTVGLATLVVPRLSRRSLGDVRVVPLVVALLVVGGQLAQPVQNGISRRVELRADVTALESVPDPEEFVALQRQLAIRSLADPTPPRWSSWWWGSHPGVLTRVALAARAGSATAGGLPAQGLH